LILAVALIAATVRPSPEGPPSALAYPPCLLFDRAGRAICGGLCLPSGTVLTAAHCAVRGVSVVRQTDNYGRHLYGAARAVRVHPLFIGLDGPRGRVAYDLATLETRAAPQAPSRGSYYISGTISGGCATQGINGAEDCSSTKKALTGGPTG
jgi:hypothetical protein